jgi:hypothetical protein
VLGDGEQGDGAGRRRRAQRQSEAMAGGAAMEAKRWLGGRVMDIGNPSGSWTVHVHPTV